MKVLNFGSLNLDYVYSVDHRVTPGETLASYGMNVFCGEDIPKHRLPFCRLKSLIISTAFWNFPKGGAYLPITQGTIFPSEDPTNAF